MYSTICALVGLACTGSALRGLRGQTTDEKFTGILNGKPKDVDEKLRQTLPLTLTLLAATSAVRNNPAGRISNFDYRIDTPLTEDQEMEMSKEKTLWRGPALGARHPQDEAVRAKRWMPPSIKAKPDPKTIDPEPFWPKIEEIKQRDSILSDWMTVERVSDHRPWERCIFNDHTSTDSYRPGRQACDEDELYERDWFEDCAQHDMNHNKIKYKRELERVWQKMIDSGEVATIQEAHRLCYYRGLEGVFLEMIEFSEFDSIEAAKHIYRCRNAYLVEQQRVGWSKRFEKLYTSYSNGGKGLFDVYGKKPGGHPLKAGPFLDKEYQRAGESWNEMGGVQPIHRRSGER